MEDQQNLIIYHADDGKAKVALYTRYGDNFINQAQLAEISGTSVQNISNHILNILNEKELLEDSVINDYLITGLSSESYKEPK